MTRIYSKQDIDGYHYELHCLVKNNNESLLHLCAHVYNDIIVSLNIDSYTVYGVGFLNNMEVLSFINRCYRIVSGSISVEDASVLEFD